MTAAKFLITGQVQGVGFRWFVARHSRRLGLIGHAANLPDGRVEVVVSGPSEGLNELAGLLRSGPAHASVSQVEMLEISDDHVRYKSFEIL